MSPEVETAVSDRKAQANVAQATEFAKAQFYAQERLAVYPKSAEPLETAIDVYDGPAGKGYVVRAELVIKEIRWVKLINIGPETYREHDWTPCLTT
mgnify:FL=1